MNLENLDCEQLSGRRRQICQDAAGELISPEQRAAYLAEWCRRGLIDCADADLETWDVSQPSRGLGDTIAKITSKVGIKPCRGCKGRQTAINRVIPFKRQHPFLMTSGTPEFVTTAKFMQDIKRLASMLPADTSRIIGVSRSGLCAASMIAMILHRPLTIVRQSAGDIVDGGNGWRLSGNTKDDGPAVVVDDTCMTGNSTKHVRKIVEKQFNNFLMSTVYCNPNAKAKPDIWSKELAWPHLLEWNLFNSILSPGTAVDFDGILCHDCPPKDDDDGPQYLEFLKNVKPLYLVRRAKVPLIVTARLEKYRPQTIEWLHRHGVTVTELVMGPWRDNKERAKSDIAAYKAEHYRQFLKKRHRLKPPLFIESDARQAKRIAELSGGIVVCPAAGRCFGSVK